MLKSAALLIPAIRRLYEQRNILLARVAEQEEDLRRLEAERARLSEDHVASAGRLLTRTDAMEAIVRAAQERVGHAADQLEAARLQMHERFNSIESRFNRLEHALDDDTACLLNLKAPRYMSSRYENSGIGVGILLSGASGQPNFGDEKIAGANARFHLGRSKHLWLNSLNPHVSLGCLSADGVAVDAMHCIDELWCAAQAVAVTSIADAIRHGMSAFDGGAPRGTFSELLSTAKTFHLHGGGYINSMWPQSAVQVGVALAMKRRFGTRLLATGIGLMPLNAADQRAMAEAASQFDGFECRDRASADALRAFGANVECGVDDAFIESVGPAGQLSGPPDLHLCLQLSELEESCSQRILYGVRAFVERYSEEIGKVTICEFCPKGDGELLRQATFLGDRHRIVIKPLGELIRFGLKARAGDLAIVTRFHAHLFFHRMGVRGVFLEQEIAKNSSEYYQVKHRSLLDIGSNWKRCDDLSTLSLNDFPPIPDWKDFSERNETMKRYQYSRFFLE